MSRIGKNPIKFNTGVEIKIDNNVIKIKGPKGELSRTIRPEIKAEVKDNEIILTPVKETKNTSAFWGLSRALVANMVRGVTEGYEKKLIIEGIGFKAVLDGKNLILSLGFSHPVKIEVPAGIEFKVEKNVIIISGIDKELVGEIAAKIRRKKKPEPYKGKGIRYINEVVRRKVGKKGTA